MTAHYGIRITFHDVLYKYNFHGGECMKKNMLLLYIRALEKCKSKDVGDFMCKRLKELNGKSAEDILKASGQLQNIPVDLEKIIETIKVFKYPRTFDDIEKIENEEVAGLVLLRDDDIGIFYDAEATIKQKRFIIAHEIGHCCLHGDTLKEGYIEFLHKDGYADEHEKEASLFAARLLIPEESLLSIYNRLILPSLNGLSDIFEVPKHLMKYRLEELKMRYYLDERDVFITP